MCRTFCCASGHAAVDPALASIKTRRRIAFSKAGLRDFRLQKCDYSRYLRPAKRGSGVRLHGSNPEPLMSALGQKRTSGHDQIMSALPPKADIGIQPCDVCFVQADID